MRRDPLSIRKRAIDDCSFKNSLVFVSKTARYSFQRQPAIRFKDSPQFVSKIARYSFQKQPGIRFKSSLVSGSLRSFDTTVWRRRATTPDVAAARRRRAADYARREGLPTVDRPFAPYARTSLAYGTSGLHGRCDGPPFRRARACTRCRAAGECGGAATWAPRSLISAPAGRRGGTRSPSETPATAGRRRCSTPPRRRRPSPAGAAAAKSPNPSSRALMRSLRATRGATRPMASVGVVVSAAAGSAAPNSKAPIAVHRRPR